MTEDELRKLSAEHNKKTVCSCRFSDYLAWQNFESLPEKWKDLGCFDFKMESLKRNGYTQHPVDKKNFENYWSEKAVIAVHYYPYHDCEFYQCSECKAVFMSYVESGGHAPQNRVKYVSTELIDGKF